VGNPSPINSTAPIDDSGNIWLDGETVRSRRYRLTVVTGPEAGKAIDLHGSLVIGTHPDTGLQLTDPAVSRYHVELRVESDGVLVVDLKSSNGTFVSGNRIERMVVRKEATLTVGRTALRISVFEETLGHANTQRTTFGRAIGTSEGMRRLFGLLERVAPTRSTVLLLGETGTGKELLAEGIHLESPRREGPLVVVDCGAIAPTLFESELFGHVKGAFTGAHTTRKGAFEEANGGTIFLDEIGELPLDLQPKLLRALERGVIRPVGDDAERPVDVRVVAATHRNLLAEVEANRFRRDLYFRLAVVVARVPPLRERLDDLPVLVETLLKQLQKDDVSLPESLFDRFRAHSWPGNVRELRNVLERALVEAALHPDVAQADARAKAKALSPAELTELEFKEAKDRLVDTFTRDYIGALFERHKGNVSAVARAAGLNRNYVRELIVRFKLRVE
jgi:transcriptional regulator with PAS, ATPase and Fis domain